MSHLTEPDDLPLTADNMTASLRIMAPAYVALFVLLGIAFGLTPLPRVLDSPPLAYAADLLPMPVWSALFIALGVLLGVALWRGSRGMFRYGLFLGVACMGVWAVMFGAAIFFSSASYAAWIWPAFVAVCCYASSRSLTRNERPERRRLNSQGV